MRKRNPRSRHQWHLLYYLLAFFNILTISFSAYVNHQVHSAFNQSVEAGQAWHARFEGVNELHVLAGRIKAPVDKLFQSRDVERAREQMEKAHKDFQEALSDRLGNLREETEHMDVQELFDAVTKARNSMQAATEHSRKLLDRFGSVSLEESVAAKGRIDSEMLTFNAAITGISLEIGRIQMKSFQEQLVLSDRQRSGQYILIILIGVMLVLAVYYGRRITERMDRDAEQLDSAHQQLVESARAAGMAEIATGVLHNVGNVLNSVNVSATVVCEKLGKSKVGNVSRVSDLMEQNKERLGEFLTDDEKGKQVPGFLATLAEHLQKEREEMNKEMNALGKSIQHIKSIISMQQSYAKVAGVSETCQIPDIIEDAIRLNAVSLQRHDIRLIREIKTKIDVTIERHKVLQILVNLMRNAKDSLDKVDGREKQMTIRVTEADSETIIIAVKDNGIGMSEETMNKLFQHGFTTRKKGHGFGLHSGALAAKEMGGSLTADSDGVGTGATFTLKLPIQPLEFSEGEW